MTPDRLLIPTLLLCGALLLPGCTRKSDEQPPPPAPPAAAEPKAAPALSAGAQREAQVERAQKAMTLLGSRLKDALIGAMERGPAAAITVCQEKAPEIAAAISDERVLVGRTSHRLRNPKNEPRPWVAPILAELLEGKPTADMLKTVELPGGSLGVVKPILAGPLCLTCHGQNVAPELAKKIKELYPEDKATGFDKGQLRGVFWAEVRPVARR